MLKSIKQIKKPGFFGSDTPRMHFPHSYMLKCQQLLAFFILSFVVVQNFSYLLKTLMCFAFCYVLSSAWHDYFYRLETQSKHCEVFFIYLPMDNVRQVIDILMSFLCSGFALAMRENI